MATLAEHRPAGRQHAGVIRAVRVVAIAAVFGSRRMLPQVRATLFGVAVEAGLVQRLLCELPLGCRAVRTVTSSVSLLPVILSVPCNLPTV